MCAAPATADPLGTTKHLTTESFVAFQKPALITIHRGDGNISHRLIHDRKYYGAATDDDDDFDGFTLGVGLMFNLTQTNNIMILITYDSEIQNFIYSKYLRHQFKLVTVLAEILFTNLIRK